MLTVALFGEAEKGSYSEGTLVHSLAELSDFYGNPPPESLGLFYAVQVLLYQHYLLYFRVREEGLSLSDYQHGVEILVKDHILHDLAAVCLPKVGSRKIIDTVAPVCTKSRSFLITTEKDLWDYLTDR